MEKRIKTTETIYQINGHQFKVVNTKIIGVDDPVYAKYKDAWEQIPRGMSDVYCNEIKVASVQGLRKFSYHPSDFGMLDRVKTFLPMQKENGENAQIGAFEHNGEMYWIGGSKNVHIVFQKLSDIDNYADQKYDYARPIALWCLKNLSDDFQKYLAQSKFTAIGEAIFANSQHLVDYGSVGDHIRFFALSESGPYQGKLTAVPPQVALDKFKSFNLAVPEILDAVDYPSEAYDKTLNTIACMLNSEGCVMYGLDEIGQTVYMCKTKSVQYNLERSLREATFKGCSEEDLRKLVLTTIAKTTKEDQQAIRVWQETRLEFMLQFSAWMQYTDQTDRGVWITKQHEFRQVKLPDGCLSWFEVLQKAKPDKFSRTIVIASRGLPLSGKSTVMRSLQVVLESLGYNAVWINQDELGNKASYLRAFTEALKQKSDYILLDKSNRAIENLVDITDINGPVDHLLNFAHLDDDLDEDEATLAREVCASRHLSRKGHRTIDADTDINKVLGFMAAMRISRPKLNKKALNITDIDITQSSMDMLQKVVTSLGIEASKDQLEYGIQVSRDYEQCLADNYNIRYVFFGISMNEDVVPALKRVAPEAFPPQKNSLSKQHVTIAYMGDLVNPELYVKLFRQSTLQQEVGIEVIAIHSDNKCTTASVEIKDDQLSWLCQNSRPHITLALTKKTPPVYSNELLNRGDGDVFKVPEDYSVLYGTLQGYGGQSTGKKSMKTIKSKPQSVKLPDKLKHVKGVTVASDIGGVLFQTWRSKDEDHTIGKVEETLLVPHAWESLRLLRDAGYNLYLLSYCGYSTEQKTRQALAQYNVNEIVPESKWLFCRKRSDKIDLMHQHHIDCIIDDTHEIIQSVRAGGKQAVHFTQEKTRTWPEVLVYLDTYYSQPKGKESTDLEQAFTQLKVND